VTITGHAIEARINAENPWTFAPSPGKITGYNAPGGPGIRIDSAVHEHAVVQPYYDSLVAKLISTGTDRAHAIRRLSGAMQEYVVEGIHTTLPLQRLLVNDPLFTDVRYHTRIVDGWLKERRDSEG
jgi:acetyl-CoA carboxylase biotin carboxylase subunit